MQCMHRLTDVQQPSIGFLLSGCDGTSDLSHALYEAEQRRIPGGIPGIYQTY